MTRVAGWMLAVMAILCLPALGQEVLVFNDSSTANGLACLMAAPPSPLPPGYPIPACPVPGIHYLVQGKRTELQVFNRKFLTDYSISIDGVTQIQTGPNIRNLNEAENLTLGAATLASVPPSKGGAEGLTARSATQMLLELLDETTSTKPQRDLTSDLDVVERERAKVQAQMDDFAQHYELRIGILQLPPTREDCQAVVGSPSALPLRECLDEELFREQQAPWPPEVVPPYRNEPEFRNVNTRVHDLVKAVRKLGKDLADSDLPGKLRGIEAGIAQYDNDVITLRGSLNAARDAARLALLGVNDDFRTKLRRQETKVLLLDKLKGADGKPTLDEAEMNALLDLFEESVGSGKSVADANARALRDALQERVGRFDREATGYERSATDFNGLLADFRSRMNVRLPDAIDDLNASQSRLLNRVNEIYDHSEVREPLPRQINLSRHSGNVVVYYTIRRIETFQRYTVVQVQGPDGAQASAAGTPLPPVQSAPSSAPPSATSGNPAANSGGNAAAGNGSASGNPQDAGEANQGIVVAKGSFEVHDVFHANVVAAIVFSTLKDQSIAKLAQPQSCSGTSTSPDNNCFAPFLNGNNHKWAPLVGLDYYFQRRDTFPRSPDQPWLCQESPGQCFGIMGAASATSANNYFLGGFFEPTLGVQFGAGANFGTRTVLDSGYKFGTPVDTTGDFPTHEARATGVFISAGLDLGIFRKIFGKVTGIGTSASGTSGQ